MKIYLTILLLFYCIYVSYGQDGFVEGKPRLAYWQTGQKQSTVIVLHGGPAAPHDYLRPEFDALTQTSRVIYYDQRGCGKSDLASSYIWQEHVSDLKRLIETLSKDKKVFLVASSWGCTLAILYTYKYPNDVKGLILSGTVLWRGEEKAYKRDSILSVIPIKKTMASVREAGTIIKQKSGSQAVRDTINISKTFEITTGLPQNEPTLSWVSAPKVGSLKQITTPILIINGTNSQRFDGVDQYLTVFPHIQVQTIIEAGHDPWLKDPKLFFLISNKFISDIIE